MHYYRSPSTVVETMRGLDSIAMFSLKNKRRPTICWVRPSAYNGRSKKEIRANEFFERGQRRFEILLAARVKNEHHDQIPLVNVSYRFTVAVTVGREIFHRCLFIA